MLTLELKGYPVLNYSISSDFSTENIKYKLWSLLI